MLIHSYKDYCKAEMFAEITFFLKVISAPSILGTLFTNLSCEEGSSL